MRKFLIILLCILNLENILAQEVPKYELDSIDLLSFKEEAKYKYLLFFESILNLIDTRLDVEDRYRSRSVMLGLFDNSTSTISDILYSPNPTSYDPYTYGYELLKGSQELPVLYKRFKYSDDFEFKRKSYKGVNLETDNKAYDIYEGEMFILEKLIKSTEIPPSLINNPTFNVYVAGLLKKVRFKIAHNGQREYELKITSIDILSPNNKAYDHKKIIKSIELSNYKWSDQSEEEYVTLLTNEAIEKGVLPPADTLNKIKEAIIEKEINLVFKQDTLRYKKPKFVDYLIPGYAHIRYGLNDNSRFFKTILYGGVFVTSASLSVYNKIQSERSYNLHQNAITFRVSNDHYKYANTYHKRFIVGTGVAVASMIVNAVHLNYSHKSQMKKIDQSRKNKINNNSSNSSFGFLIPKLNLSSDFSLIWKL